MSNIPTNENLRHRSGREQATRDLRASLSSAGGKGADSFIQIGTAAVVRAAGNRQGAGKALRSRCSFKAWLCFCPSFKFWRTS